ncbi:MAG TPA: ABC transporter ATP-binding protein [Gemmatimonadaceae bacterium]|nr:ABC transporter ATP-binding protein [Gemmatimonadaceae bacterium]
MSILAKHGAASVAQRHPDAPIIALHNVEKGYKMGGGTSYVLRRIMLVITPGEFVTIMGPSGAGKSTLLAILGMLDPVFSGQYWFRGLPVHDMNVGQRQSLARAEIGVVFQQYHLLDDLTVAENLSVPLDYRGVSRSDRAARVADILDRFNIVGKKDLYPSQLSGGQQQLVGIARAVVAEPSLILADEPTGNLHSAQAREIMELFARLNAAGTTIVQVTHSDENARYGTRTIRLSDGWMES